MTSRSKSPTAAAPFILPSTGRVIREEQNDYIIEHAHDAAGKLFTSRGGFGHLMEFDYNGNNRLESATIEDNKYIRIVCAMPPAGPSYTIFPAPSYRTAPTIRTANLPSRAPVQVRPNPGNTTRLVNERIYSRNKRGQLIRLEDHHSGNRTFACDRARPDRRRYP